MRPLSSKPSVASRAIRCAVALLLLSGACPTADAHTAPDFQADSARAKYRNRWNALIPRRLAMQMYGGMGLVSLGVGWEYGSNRQWETDFLIGFLPKYYSENPKITFTLKETYVPWTIDVKRVRGLSVEPLTAGIYVNTIADSEFWAQEPDKYPRGYYGFSTKVRLYLALGQRLRFDLPNRHRRHFTAITVFYEVNTCDIYIAEAVGNSYLKPRDYLRLSFGLLLDIF